MNVDIRELLQKQDGLAVDYGDDGMILLDRSGRCLKHIQVNKDASVEIERFLADADSDHAPEQKRKGESIARHEFIAVVVTVFLESIAAESTCVGVASLIKSLAAGQPVIVRVFFQQPPACWRASLDDFYSALGDLIGQERVKLTLYGAFGSIDNSAKEFLMEYKTHLVYVYNPDDEAARIPHVLETICDIADFGFRMPVAWYIHAENIDKVRALIDDNMCANYSSGFALPLIAHSPYYDGFKNTLQLPASRDYLELLVDVYKRFPFYDEVVYPVSALADIAYHGGLDRNGLPRGIRLSVSLRGEARLYGHIPVLSVPWMNLSELQTMEPSQVQVKLRERCSALRSECLSSHCRACPWKNLCGGEYTAESLEPFNVHCEMMSFFLKSFLWQRGKAMDVAMAKRNGAREKDSNSHANSTAGTL
jgi:hypothetical protein